MVRTDCHIFLFPPLTSAKKTLFLPKIVSQSPLFFHTVKNFGNFSLKDPKSAGIWEKGTQMPPIFMAFVTTRPPIFCLACTCLRGMLLPQTRSAEAGKLCILETESCNLVNTFRCKLNQGDENKISVLQAQPTQLYIRLKKTTLSQSLREFFNPTRHAVFYFLFNFNWHLPPRTSETKNDWKV